MALSYAILIPARLASTRLPRKLLLAESGKPLIQHVVERARLAVGSPAVIVCTADDEIAEAVAKFGGEIRSTRDDHASGTTRCAEVAETLSVDVVVNLQGDEPLVDPSDLARVAYAAEDADMATLASPFASEGQLDSPHAVKALRDEDGWALAFQRARPEAVPGDVDVLHHVGIYAFRRERLVTFASLPSTASERRERLEQLRALDHQWRIRVIDASRPAFGIDTREDYEAFLAVLDA